MQALHDEQRKDDREVVADRPDDEQHRERDPKVGHGEDVAQTGPNLPGARGVVGSWRISDARIIESETSTVVYDERVDREAPAVADA